MKALRQGALSRLGHTARDRAEDCSLQAQILGWGWARHGMARRVSGRAKCGQEDLSCHFAWRICIGKDYKAPVQGDLSLISQTLAFL